MPSQYVIGGLVGVLVGVGLLIWTVFNQPSPNTEYQHPKTDFIPEPGYDRPRDSRADEEASSSRDSSRRRRRGTIAKCAICREPLVDLPCRKLPCNHEFHHACVTKWFRESRTCPTCRCHVA